MDDFHDLVGRSRAFFALLANNNNRDWFADNKARYEAEVKRPAELFLDAVSARIARDLDQPTKPKMYRVYRDVRFSKDKTPYNTHLHLQWSMPDAPVCFLFGASASYCKLGVGAMVFPKDALPRWRDRVAAGNPVVAESDALEAAGWALSEPELKRVPSPYPQDHPQGAHLRRKGLVAWRDLDADAMSAPTQSLAAGFETAQGFRRALLAALA